MAAYKRKGAHQYNFDALLAMGKK